METKVLLLQISENNGVVGRLFTHPAADLLVALEAVNGCDIFNNGSADGTVMEEREEICFQLVSNTIASLEAEYQQDLETKKEEAVHKLPELAPHEFIDCKPDKVVVVYF